ncbi:hypothetical protein UlMin_010424 [Ulmus minor]
MDNRHLRHSSSSGLDNHGVYVCHKCGWPFPNPHPSAKLRRAHKRICGTIEGYKLVELEGSAHSTVSDDERNSDEDHKLPSPKVLEASNHEKRRVATRELSIRSEDDVFSDAAADFSDSGASAGTQGRLRDVGQPETTVERNLTNESSSIESVKAGPIAETNEPHGDAPDSSQLQKTEDSSLLFDGDKNGSADNLYPVSSEAQKDELDVSEKAKAIDYVADGSSALVGQEFDVDRTSESNLADNRRDDNILLGEIAGKTDEANSNPESPVGTSEPLQAAVDTGAVQLKEEHNNGFHLKIPQDVSSQVDSVELVNADTDPAGAKVDVSEGINIVNYGDLVESPDKGEEHSNGFHLKIPQDVSSQVDSVEQVNTDTDPAGAKVDVTEGINFVNYGDLVESPDKGEDNANFHVLSVPSDINVVDLPEIMLEGFKDPKIMKLDQYATLDSELTKRGDAKDPVVEEILQFDQLSEGNVVSSSDRHGFEDTDQLDQASSMRRVQDVPIEEEADLSHIKEKFTENQSLDEIGAPVDADSVITSSNAGVIQTTHVVVDDHEKAENLNVLGDDNSKGRKEEDNTDHFVMAAESFSNVSEIQVHLGTNLTEGDGAGDEKVESDKDDVARDANEGHVKNETGLANNDGPAEENFSENPLVFPDTVNMLSEVQFNNATNLQEGNDFSNNEKDNAEKCVDLGIESKGETVEAKSIPESNGNVQESQTVAENIIVGSSEKVLDIGYSDTLESSRAGINMVSDTQLGTVEEKLSANDKVQELVEVTGAAQLEPNLSPVDANASIQDPTATEDSSGKDNGVASELGSQSFQGQNDRPKLGGSIIDTAVDSSSQSDSLEGNWGSVSVLSIQSDMQTGADAEALAQTGSQAATGEKTNSNQSKVVSELQHPDKSEMYEPPSFMTLVETGGGNNQNAAASEIQTVQNSQQQQSSSLQAGWFPSITQVVNESPGRKKNEEIIAKVTNWTAGKQHTPLKNLLGEASLENRAKSPKRKENVAPELQKSDQAATTTVNSIMAPESPLDQAATNREIGKEWNSPARYPTEIKREKRKPKNRPYWAQFVCCSSVK